MTKPWDLIEDEARRLYSSGRSLKRLRAELEQKHGFEASERAWRNRIERWGIKKHRASNSLAPSRCSHCDGETRIQRPRRPPLTPVEPPVAGQDSQHDPMILDERTAGSPLPDIESNGSSMELFNQSSPGGLLSAIPDDPRLTKGNERSIEHPISASLPTVSNKAIYERLSDPRISDGEGDAILHDAKITQGEENILHFAARQRGTHRSYWASEHIIRYMVSRDHPLDMLDGTGQTALEIAIRCDETNVMCLLCTADSSLADIKHQDGSLLHLAIRYSSEELCTELLDRVKDVDKKDALGNTPLQLAAYQGYNFLVDELLSCSARLDDEGAENVILHSRLDIDDDIDLLDREFFQHKEPTQIDGACRRIVEFVLRKPLDPDHVVTYQKPFSFLKHICRTYPKFLSDNDYNQGKLFQQFQEKVEAIYKDFLTPDSVEIIEIIDDCIRRFLRKGFRPPSNGDFLYTGTKFIHCAGILSYTYVKACVEVCDIDDFGQSLFALLEYLVENQEIGPYGPDEYALGSKLGESKLFDLLQTLLDRGLALDIGINLLSFVMKKVPDSCMERGARLLNSTITIQKHSLMDACSKYGHPLDLLARTPEPSCWRYAEILLNNDTLVQLLGTPSPLSTLDSATAPDTAWMPGLSAYTLHPSELRRCILHVLTRTALDKISVDFHLRLAEILGIRWYYGLPELRLRLDNTGQFNLIDDDAVTKST